jgi:hypothetical protein
LRLVRNRFLSVSSVAFTHPTVRPQQLKAHHIFLKDGLAFVDAHTAQFLRQLPNIQWSTDSSMVKCFALYLTEQLVFLLLCIVQLLLIRSSKDSNCFFRKPKCQVPLRDQEAIQQFRLHASPPSLANIKPGPKLYSKAQKRFLEQS